MVLSQALSTAPPRAKHAVEPEIIYEQCLGHGVPDFDEIYDQYVSAVIDLKTSLTVQQIDSELFHLRQEFGDEVFSVEHGFNFEAANLQKQFFVIEALMYHQLFFKKANEFYNQPVVGVW
jgi:hypothetical protein